MKCDITRESCVLESNNLQIHYDIYLDSNLENAQYKALVQIAHGMVEHRGKYAGIAEFLAKNGFIVAINDHRGHGDSVNYDLDSRKYLGESSESNLGESSKATNSSDSDESAESSESNKSTPKIREKIYLGEMGANGFETALDDMHNLHLALKERFKPRKFILIGHSMGSLLSRRFLQEYEDCLDMLILCGTPKPEPFVNVGIAFLRVLRCFGLNNVARSVANKFSLLSFNAKYAKIDTLANGKNSGQMWINRDINELKRNLADKKTRFIFSINSFINLFVGLKRVFSPYPRKVANSAYESRLPILFISGEDDACGGFGKGALKAFKHIIAQGYGNARLILYANARHELFLELNKDEVLSDLVRFIEKNL